MDENRLTVGELAGRTGLTVRTLHHWDELGLLAPAERTGAGYRLYGESEVERVYRITALRSLGLELSQIRELLDGGADLRALVERQLTELEARIELERRLRRRLLLVRDALAEPGGPSADDLLETIEVMTMIEKYYSDEQLAELARRREALGPGGMEQAQRDWAELYADVEHEQRAGTDPADPRAQALVARADALIEAFTAGDPGIRASLEHMYREQGPENASRGMVKPKLAEYLNAARAARRG
jgi:MerR family transcriptional regulator, thiopeptide resistance regulator